MRKYDRGPVECSKLAGREQIRESKKIRLEIIPQGGQGHASVHPNKRQLLSKEGAEAFPEMSRLKDKHRCALIEQQYVSHSMIMLNAEHYSTGSCCSE